LARAEQRFKAILQLTERLRLVCVAMTSLRVLVFALTLPLGCHGHGLVTRPVSRNQLLGNPDGNSMFGAGLNNPGANDCSITSDNSMSMNGCQGAGHVIDPNACLGNCSTQGLPADAPAKCKRCWAEYASNYEKNKGMQTWPRVGVCGDIVTRDAFKDVFSSTWNFQKNVTTPAGAADFGHFDTLPLLEGPGKRINVTLQITAHHWGWAEFRLCRRGKTPGGVTQECFNKDILSFDVNDAKTRYPKELMNGKYKNESRGDGPKYFPADPSDYKALNPHRRCDKGGGSTWDTPATINASTNLKKTFPKMYGPGGNCCFEGGTCVDPESPNQDQRWVFPAPSAQEKAKKGSGHSKPSGGGITATNGYYYVVLKLPDDVDCTRDEPCTLQWLYMTGNSQDSYPEAFRTCSDFALSEPATTRKGLRR